MTIRDVFVCGVVLFPSATDKIAQMLPAYQKVHVADMSSSISHFFHL